MAIAFLKRMRIQCCWVRHLSTNSIYESAITDLNKLNSNSHQNRAPIRRREEVYVVTGKSGMKLANFEDLSKVSPKEMESIFGVAPSSSGIDSTPSIEHQALPLGSYEGQQGLSHVNTSGKATMVDVSPKEDTRRVAIATCRVLLGQKAFHLVAANEIAKGDVLNVAKIAGIAGAKQTSNLIPLCHNIGLTHIRVDLTLNEKDLSVEIEGEAATTGKTGVEMEAMTAVTVAGLTVYDMCKAASKDIEITDVRLGYKSGGKSGTWSRHC